MKILIPAIAYELPHLGNAGAETLRFIRKKTVEGELITVQEGTTTEAVLEALIDRTKELMSEYPSRESALACTKMEEALMWFNSRQRDRQARGVQGQHKL